MLLRRVLFTIFVLVARIGVADGATCAVNEYLGNAGECMTCPAGATCDGTNFKSLMDSIKMVPSAPSVK